MGSADPKNETRTAPDYWLGKFIFELQQTDNAARYRADRGSVLDRYPLSNEVRAALREDDLEGIIGRVNPYLLRYYFACVGWSDAQFIRRLQDWGRRQESAHG